MTGPENSIIGMDPRKAIERFIMQSHVYYSLANGPVRLNGAVVTIDPSVEP